MSKSKDKKAITVGFYALGCPKNIIDSERMLAEIAQAGFIITPETDNADVVVINTCGFIEPAKQEALKIIKDNIELKRKGEVKKIIVAGCLPQRLQSELAEQFPEIDAVLSLTFRDKIANIIKKTFSANDTLEFLDKPPDSPSNDKTRLLITPSHYGYLRISDGCNWRCSFCTIPSIRGGFRSKPIGNILSEAQQLASTGVREVIIIAQASTSYGRDLKKAGTGLPELLKGLEKIKDVKWLRLMYAYPTDVTDGLLETMAGSKKILHYIDLPLQHINNQILKDMNRPDTEEGNYQLIEKLRGRMPEVAIRTTFIVGFPGETEGQFQQLLDFIQWARFDNLGCFKFSPEAGTAAADMEDQIAEEVKQERFERLMLSQQKIAFEKNRSRIGSEVKVLIDSVDREGVAVARSYRQAPEIDSVCFIENCTAGAGDLVNAKIIDSENYDLIAEQI